MNHTFDNATCLKRLMRSSSVRLLPGEVEAPSLVGPSYTFTLTEERIEYSAISPKSPMQTLQYSETFRGSAGVFFLKSPEGDVVLTNLPIHQVNTGLLQQVQTLEGQALLALSLLEGHGLHFIEEKAGEAVYLQNPKSTFASTAEEFRATFLEPVLEDGKTRALLRSDVDDWFKKQVNWRQALWAAPGEEW